MVGGSPEAFLRATPLFAAMGKNIVRVGPSGAGQIAKACNQLVVAATIEAVAEALVLAERAGVDAAKVREALLGGFAGSKILEVHGQRMLDRTFDPGFRARLHRKDARIVLDTAKEVGAPVPAFEAVARQLDELVDDRRRRARPQRAVHAARGRLTPQAFAHRSAHCRELLHHLREVLPALGEPVVDPHRRIGRDGARDDAQGLELLQPLGQHGVGDAGDPVADVGEPGLAGLQGAHDLRDPPPPDSSAARWKCWHMGDSWGDSSAGS